MARRCVGSRATDSSGSSRLGYGKFHENSPPKEVETLIRSRFSSSLCSWSGSALCVVCSSFALSPVGASQPQRRQKQQLSERSHPSTFNNSAMEMCGNCGRACELLGGCSCIWATAACECEWRRSISRYRGTARSPRQGVEAALVEPRGPGCRLRQRTASHTVRMAKEPLSCVCLSYFFFFLLPQVLLFTFPIRARSLPFRGATLPSTLPLPFNSA